MGDVLLVRWGNEHDALVLSPEESAFDAVATRFGLLPGRVTLVCKGKKYPNVLPQTATAELLALCTKGATVLVVGTRAEQQLDAPRGPAWMWRLDRVPVVGWVVLAVRWLVSYAWRVHRAWSPHLWSYAKTAAHVPFVFIGSLFPRTRAAD